MSNGISNYDSNCCSKQAKSSFKTGHVKNGYTVNINGTITRADGLDLTSAARGQGLSPNGSKASEAVRVDKGLGGCCK